jgi:hypothetical protein
MINRAEKNAFSTIKVLAVLVGGTRPRSLCLMMFSEMVTRDELVIQSPAVSASSIVNPDTATPLVPRMVMPLSWPVASIIVFSRFAPTNESDLVMVTSSL